MRRRLTARSLAATFTATALTLGLPAPGSARTAAPQAAVPISATPAAAPTVTVRPDPSYQGQEFEGWGTSLVWFANATGGYPAEIRDKLADMVFGKQGLNLNIARYNIGGGNAPDVPAYLRPGGAVEGWWQAPAGTTRTDVDWWNPADPAHWNLNADKTQRWWVDRIKKDITHWETFSNSPPYFQTVSGYVSGGLDSSQDQIRSSTVNDFAAYLARVNQELEKAHGIKIATTDPLNEPNTPYWGTRLGADGNPVGGGQEGAHAGPALQQQVIRALAAKLTALGSHTKVSAMDETNPGTFEKNWNAYPEDVRALVSQLNVHTYGTGQRTTVRDIAKGEQKPLWMSEVEGSWGNGQNFTSMTPGLGMAQRMVDDLRELEPTAWVFWQPVEDYDNMKPGGESAAGANWGSIQLPFNCTAKDTLKTCPIYTNTKFNTVRNFTHYIRPGDRLIKVGDTSSVAAVSAGKRATVVHINDTKQARTVRLDLSAFGTVAPNATVTPVFTSASGALKKGLPIAVRNNAASVLVPAESVTSLLVTGVSGIAPTAALVQSGHVYRLKGVQSGKSLTPNAAGTGTVLRTEDPSAAAQLWSFTPLTTATSNQSRYAVSTATGTSQLAVVDGALTLVPAVKTPATNAQWIMSTTGDGTYTLVNVATKRVVEVGGQATQDGSAVSTWLPNSGFNQRWEIIDESVLGIQPTAVFTVPGVAPTMPTTVVPTRRDGARGALPVVWKLPAASAWKRPGSVPVLGTATDALGVTHVAKATVEVDTLVYTRPGRAKTFVGGNAKLPATVTAVGKRGVTTQRPVTWKAPAAGAFDKLGVVTIAGRADAGDGRTLPATVRVQVTARGEQKAPTTEITATFTEPGYSAAGLRNGILIDKAWSNWVPGTKNTGDTLTVELGEQQAVTRVVTYFYKDGGDSSWAQTLQVQARDAQGAWSDAGSPVSVAAGTDTAPAVSATSPATTNAVRVVLTAPPSQHMTASEIEVYTAGPSTSSDAAGAGITLSGVPVPGFIASRTSYSVRVRGKLPKVAAVAADPYATVVVTQPTARNRTATITITSEDGTQKRTYRVALTK